MNNLNCEDLPGRLRDICRGHDKDGNPVLTPEKCERYRKFFVDGQFGADHPRAAKAIDPKNERRAAVQDRLAQRKRLISWLQFFRHPTDRGIGDTANRLKLQRRKPGRGGQSDGQEAVKRLLAQCSCSKTESVARLNREYPY